MLLRGKGSTLLLRLPKVEHSADIDLEINAASVQVAATGLYQPLHVALPDGLDDDRASARWDSKARELRVYLPRRRAAS